MNACRRSLALLLALPVLLLPTSCRVNDIQDAFSLVTKHTENLSKASEGFSSAEEYYLGRAVSARILERYPALDDAAANKYVNQLGQALALFSEQPLTYGGYHFQLLDSDEVNAFAAPGGFIFVTKGMLRHVAGESELAAVLAHEISHIQNSDAVKAIKSSRMTEALLALGKDASGNYVPLAPLSELVSLFDASVSDIVTSLVSKGYSRDQEYAADAAALIILAQAGYDPKSLSAVLGSMEKTLRPGGTDFASTHPSASSRLAALNSAAAPALPEPKARFTRFNEALGRYARTEQ